MLTHLRLLAAGGLALGALFLGSRLLSEPAASTTATGLIRELPTPATPDSGESNVFTGPDGTVYLTWCDVGYRAGERALRLATLASGASAWSHPGTIVSTPLLMENWADFPSLMVGTDGTLWAQWFQRPADAGQRGYSGWLARSTDQGATWSRPTPLGHEFVSLAPLSGGRVLAVWLESTRIPRDQRKPGDPAMRLESRLLGPDGAVLGEWIVDPDVCTCCQTTLAALADDRVFVAYRGHTPGEIRDHGYALFDGQAWGGPRQVHEDGWQIAGCPVNGPAADARERALAVVWYTAAQGQARVLAKYSSDAGTTFGPATPIDLGHPLGRVDLVMLPDASALITWMEAKDGENAAGIYARRLFADGAVSPATLLAESTSARASGFPRLTRRADDRVVLSWTDSGEQRRVRTLEWTWLGARPRQAAIPATSRRPAMAALEFCGDSLAAHTP